MVKKSVAVIVGLVWSVTGAYSAPAQDGARAIIKNGEGSVVGAAAMRETGDGLLIEVLITGLAPGLHAVHLHSVGKCEPPAFTSAGGHFNPLERKHGLQNSEGPHAGDLPDIYVNADGKGRYEVLLQSVTLAAGKLSLLDANGTAIVIHASPDDNVTDPAGNSGERIACGVIIKAAK